MGVLNPSERWGTMARAKTLGACALCGYRSGKTRMGRHLSACLAKHGRDVYWGRS